MLSKVKKKDLGRIKRQKCKIRLNSHLEGLRDFHLSFDLICVAVKIFRVNAMEDYHYSKLLFGFAVMDYM